MQKLFLLLIPLYGLIALPPSNQQAMVEKNGMKVSWVIHCEKIDFTVFAPTSGWVAIGLNEDDSLVGSNLIMGAFKQEQAIVSDRYIVALGQHEPVEDLGGKDHLSNVKCTEDDLGTTLTFSISRRAVDEYHFSLAPYRSYHLTMAYSMADDFKHHSAMRTAVEIIL